MACDHSSADPKRLFCDRCGKLKEAGSLARVRFQGFLGKESTNPKMEQFWETGDAEVFSQPPHHSV